jgi:type VI secretion system protein ImpL
LAVIGIAALAAFLLLGAESLEVAAIWAVLAGLLLLAAWGLVAGAQLAAQARQRPPERSHRRDQSDAAQRNDARCCAQGMLEAINTIKTSKLGLTRGARRLYELPWYMIIGNPAAGKSSAINIPA